MTEDAFLEHHLPGTSSAIVELRRKIKVLNSAYNLDLLAVILVTGESGAGKNHLSRVIAGHRYWTARNASSGVSEKARLDSFTTKFAEISLPTLPDSLIESELFGHKKGAFTGATSDRSGLLAGDVQDVLLDEIGDASPVVQAKLLGVLENRRFRPIGAAVEDEESTSARFLLATHRDLRALVKSGAFREDLFWRANEFVLTVPPLREQKENIPALLKYQLSVLAPRAMYDADPRVGRPIPQLSREDLDWAYSYSWLGNVRQMRHSLVQWLAYGGSVSLRKLTLDSDVGQLSGSDEQRSTSRAKVRERLTAARAAGLPAAPKLADLVTDACREVQQEIVAWYDEARPSADDLERLFPNAEARSVQSKLSQWRKR